MRTLIIFLVGIAFITLICVCGEGDTQHVPQNDRSQSSSLCE